MPRYDKAVTLGKLSAAVLAAIGLGMYGDSPEIVTKLAQLSLGMPIAQQLAKFMGGVSATFFQKYLDEYREDKNFNINHDLEGSVEDAFIKTVNRIEAEFFREQGIKDDVIIRFLENITFSDSYNKITRKSFHDYFFSHIRQRFKEPERVASFVSGNHQLNVTAYINSVFNDGTLNEKLSSPLTDLIQTGQLIEYFKEAFLKYFPQAFVQELKHNDKAKTAYFKNLLELNIQHTLTLKEGVAANSEKMELMHKVAVRTRNDMHKVIRSQALTGSTIAKLGKMIPKIDRIEAGISAIRAFQEKSNRWFPNLTLVTNRAAANKRDILEYNTEYVPFCGRNNELDFLFSFLDQDEQFLWCMVEGPGGIGKSRLAKEFCKMAHLEGYDAGFYKMENSLLPDDDRKFGGELDMLIIIDYALSSPAKTIKFISYIQDKIGTAAGRKKKGKGKVRVVLLDRSFEADWQVNSSSIKPSCMIAGESSDALVVQKEEDIRWTIIESMVGAELGSGNPGKLEHIKSNKEEILSQLKTIDEHKRPLFAMFAANSIIQDPEGKIGNWNIDNLIHHYLQNIERRWKKNPEYTANRFVLKELIVHNIVARQITSGELLDFVTQMGQRNTDIVDLYYDFADREINGDEYTYKGMQPDILGEFLVLDYLRHEAAKNPARGKRVLSMAWELKPETSWRTFALMYRDYFEVPHGDFMHLEQTIFGELANIATSINTVYVAQALFEITTVLGKKPENLHRMDQYISKLRKLNERAITEDMDGSRQVTHIFLQSLYGRALVESDIRQIAKYDTEIRQHLIRIGEDGEDIYVYQGDKSMYYPLTHIYGQLCFASESPLDKTKFLIETRKLYQHFPSETIAQHITFVIWNVSASFDDLAQQQQYLAQTREILEKHPSNDVILLHYMLQFSKISDNLSIRSIWEQYIAGDNIVCNLINENAIDKVGLVDALGKLIFERNAGNRHKLIVDFSTMRSLYRDSTIINILYILSLNDLVANDDGKLQQAYYISQIRELRQQYAEREHLAVFLAISLRQAILKYATNGTADTANTLLMELQAIRELFHTSKLINHETDKARSFLNLIRGRS